LLTRFTAFVAVDGEVVNRGRARRQVTQPVAMPARWTHRLGVSMGIDRRMVSAGPFPATAQAVLKAFGKAPAVRAMGPVSPKFSETTRGISEPDPAIYSASFADEAGGEEHLEAALAVLVAAMTDARSELAAGRIPRVEPLERARIAMLDALAV